MRVAYPWILFLLAFLPLAVWLRRRGWGRPATLLFPDVASVAAVFQGGRRPGSGWREWLRLSAVGLLIVAASRPQLVQSVAYRQAEGVDMVMALDISGSMSARDFDPLNRLEAAKSVVRDFLLRERGNRLGLVAFAARAYVVCPLTLDYSVVLSLLDHLQIGMTTDGTALGMAVAAACNRLKVSEARSKVIILLTDGRNNAGHVEPGTAASIAAALGIRIYTIGMGQPGGAPIVVHDAMRGDSVLLDPDGSVHMEVVDEAVLQRMARVTGGHFFRAGDQETLRSIYAEIGRMERTRLNAKLYKTHSDGGPALMGLAGLLFLAEMLVAGVGAPRLP